MVEIKLPHRGLGRGIVAIPRAPRGTVLVVEINGVHWWRLGFRPADTCDAFAGGVGGRHDDVYQYHGPATSCRLAVGDGPLHIDHFSFDGRREESLAHVNGPYRGRFDLPGAGLVQIRTDTAWSAAVEPR